MYGLIGNQKLSVILTYMHSSLVLPEYLWELAARAKLYAVNLLNFSAVFRGQSPWQWDLYVI